MELEAFLVDSTKDEFDARFDRGEFEVVRKEARLSRGVVDPKSIFQVRFQGGETLRCVLPEAEFPELYEVKRGLLWLEKEVPLRRRPEAQRAEGAAPAQPRIPPPR